MIPSLSEKKIIILKKIPKQYAIFSKNKCQKNGNSSSVIKTSLLNLFIILPEGFLSKNFILEYIMLLFNFLNNIYAEQRAAIIYDENLTIVTAKLTKIKNVRVFLKFSSKY